MNNKFQMKGIITTIQRMSISDGPGIRSTLFLKGCNLRCRWCHNPETWVNTPQIEYIESKCIGCRTCVDTCPQHNFSVNEGRLAIDRSHCLLCGKCADACPAQALRVLGKVVDVDWVVDQFMKDEIFYRNSGGGITVSGGEPFTQFEFIQELFKACKAKGLHTAIETNLTTSRARIDALLPYIDQWMCDLKMTDSQLHKEWTGVTNEHILDNISYLSSKVHLIVRTPVIPGVNDSLKELRDIRAFIAAQANDIDHEFLEFHQLGYCKFDQLGMVNPMPESIKPFKKNEFKKLIEQL